MRVNKNLEHSYSTLVLVLVLGHAQEEEVALRASYIFTTGHRAVLVQRNAQNHRTRKPCGAAAGRGHPWSKLAMSKPAKTKPA